jgi:hypothetical protein
MVVLVSYVVWITDIGNHVPTQTGVIMCCNMFCFGINLYTDAVSLSFTDLVLENNLESLYWDRGIPTDKRDLHNHPADIMLFERTNKAAYYIQVICELVILKK